MGNQKETYAIKILAEEDMNDCIEIYIDAYSKEPWNEVYSADAIQNYLDKQLKLNNFLGFGLVLEGEMIGQAYGFIMPTATADYYRIEDFCISPKHQNNGAGSAFIKLMSEYVGKIGMDNMLLNTNYNFPAFPFYQKNGFINLDESATLLLKL